MATRSCIGLQFPDGHVESIYCHWDGYPDHNGRILKECYNTFSEVYALLQLGDMSSLARTLGQCETYRDRGETETDAARHSSWVDFVRTGEEWNYLFVDGKGWTVYEGTNLWTSEMP